MSPLLRRKLVGLGVVVVLGYAASRTFAPGVTPEQPAGARPAPVATRDGGESRDTARSFTAADVGAMVQSRGTVQRILADDNDGARHQRFIVRLSSGQTLLIAHNIDVAPRVEALAVGDTVEFRGQYETNAQGGVLHWTHRAPRGDHAEGWLRHRGREYR